MTTRYAVLGVACLSFALTGCGLDRHPAYAARIKYGVRPDPVVMDPKLLGDDRYAPERPGVFPLIKLGDFFKPEHPYHLKLYSDATFRAAAVAYAELKIPIGEKVKDDERKRLQEERKTLQEEYFPKIKANPAEYQAEIAAALVNNLRDPSRLSATQHADLEAALEAIFGTPANPKVEIKSEGFIPKSLEVLQVSSEKLALGSRHYRVHCLHCHGVTGDGRGPTARWINPHPRDFRLGVFKFQSIDQASTGGDTNPARADIERTIRQGIEGTAMPSFNLLKDDEIDAMVSYVIHLSIRGKTEFYALKDSDVKDGVLTIKDALNTAKMLETINAWAKVAAEQWIESQDPARVIKVPRNPWDTGDAKVLEMSMRRGHEMFMGAPSDKTIKEFAAKLLKMSLDKTIGAAQAKKVEDFEAQKEKDALEKKKAARLKDDPKLTKEQLDETTLNDKEREALALTPAESAKLKLTAAEEAAALAPVKDDAEKTANTQAAGKLKLNCYTCHKNYGREAEYRFDPWGTLTKPNNLTLGVFRGGRRQVDIYYRIHSGILGYPMPRFGGPTVFQGNEEYIWDLVNFVSNVQYPAMRRQADIKID